MPTPFAIDASDPLSPKVTVNGEVVEGLARVSLDIQPNQAPVLFLTFAQSAGVTEGLAQVAAVQAAGDDAEAVRTFLDSLDIETLEKMSLERAGWGVTPTQAMIDALREMVT